MAIDGITLQQNGNCTYCCVESLSDELKDIVRSELSFICHGKGLVQDSGLKLHSYKSTLEEFLKRYEITSDNIKKGMIGEFLAHLLINKVLSELSTLSIYFNKEEQSIRKGFDLTYVDLKEAEIWYGEVKSGELNTSDTPDSKNRNLLNDSKNGLRDFLSGQRPNLWNSLIIDVGLSIAQSEHKKVRQLLDSDIDEIKTGPAPKNGILISVVFHDMSKNISLASIKDFSDTANTDNFFKAVVLFSIQKGTIENVIKFLKEESVS